jgi:glyoxylase-like metal-dependent hydrolase (beta-lactamase superfamily II)
LSDPGASVHIPALLERLQRFSLNPNKVTRVIITHLDADRIGGLALLRRHAPKMQVIGSPQMANQLKASAFIDDLWVQDRSFSEAFKGSHKEDVSVQFSEFKEALRVDDELTDGSSVPLGEEQEVYCIWTPGHTNLSLTYYVAPCGFAIVDETFGYYRYREVPAFGADYKLEKAVSSIAKLTTRNVSALGLAYHGALTGGLAHRYLQALEQAHKDLPIQYKAARKRGLSREEISQELKESVYSQSGGDPFLHRSLERSLSAVIDQL